MKKTVRESVISMKKGLKLFILSLSILLFTIYVLLQFEVVDVANPDEIPRSDINLWQKISDEHMRLDLYMIRIGSLTPYAFGPSDLKKYYDYKVVVNPVTLHMYKLELEHISELDLVPIQGNGPLLLDIYGEFIGNEGVIFSFGLSFSDEMLINGQRFRHDKSIYDFVRHFIPASELSNFRRTLFWGRFLDRVSAFFN